MSHKTPYIVQFYLQQCPEEANLEIGIWFLPRTEGGRWKGAKFTANSRVSFILKYSKITWLHRTVNTLKH